jgi:8-oxo-dGTP diphosphatase
MSEYPKHIIVGATCYLLRDDRVLLIERARDPYAGYWSAPGGKCEHGESPVDTVIREMHEETGLTIVNPTLRALQTSVDIAYPVQWNLWAFSATEFSGTLTANTSEGRVQWHRIADVPSLKRPYADTLFWQHVIGEADGIWQGKTVYDTPQNLLDIEVYA